MAQRKRKKTIVDEGPFLFSEEEMAAWCYCSFMEAFPQMRDKLQMPYAEHYEKAMARIEGNI